MKRTILISILILIRFVVAHAQVLQQGRPLIPQIKPMCDDTAFCPPDKRIIGTTEVPDEFVVPDGKGSFIYYYKLSKDFGYAYLLLCPEELTTAYFMYLIRYNRFEKIPPGVRLYEEHK